MNEVTANIKTESNHRLRRWLFNPFQFIAGCKALALGLAIILTSAFVAWLGNTHFDGVLDVHTGLEDMPLWYAFAEGLIIWICMVIPLSLFALIVSRSSFRLIDILGTQALARWPYLIAALVMLPDADQRVTEYLMSKVTQTTPEVAISCVDVSIVVIAVIGLVLMAVWMVALMYRAYAVSCHMKGAKAVITFILGLIIAEVLSKVAIWLLATQSGIMP